MLGYRHMTPVMYIDRDGTFPEWLADIGRFIGGALITVAAGVVIYYTHKFIWIPGLATVPLFAINMMGYGSMLMASPFDSTIKSDMDRIGWNPFNSDANAVAASNNVSFYNGVMVIRYGSTGGGGFSFGVIGLGRGASANTVRHEYGHHKQQRLLGLALYTSIIAIPSLISAATSRPSVHANRWYERWATEWGNRGWIWW